MPTMRGIRWQSLGVSRLGEQKPYETFDGDYMARDGDYVDIRKKAAFKSDPDPLVVTVNLQKGESVRLLTETSLTVSVAS